MKKFILRDTDIRERAAAAVLATPIDEERPMSVTLKEVGRTLDQNAKFHALCGDIADSGLEWAGKPRTLAQWKVLLVSGHAIATKQGAEMVPGLEGEFVNLRESTANMTRARGVSLIEYTLAFCAEHDIKPARLKAAA